MLDAGFQTAWPPSRIVPVTRVWVQAAETCCFDEAGRTAVLMYYRVSQQTVHRLVEGRLGGLCWKGGKGSQGQRRRCPVPRVRA